jgi:tetratricopeptide (TPR) repeat protein
LLILVVLIPNNLILSEKTSEEKNGEDVVALAEERFEITPAAVIPRPWVYAKTFPPLSHPGYSYYLGRQYFNKGETERARLQFESAFQKMPDSLPIALSLARVYNLEKEYHKIKKILLPFSSLSQPNYDVSLLLGKAHQNLGEFNQAISFYDKVVSSFGVNQDLLNSIGECYFRLKELEEALAAWERSLELNPNQPEIENKINSIKK